MKRYPYARKTSKRATHGADLPAGTKVARQVEKARGVPRDDRGTVQFHGGELTAASKARALKRLGL